MQKLSIFIFLTFICAAAQAKFVPGKYEGQGWGTGPDGKTTQYKLRSKITKSGIDTIYLTGDEGKQWSFETKQDGTGRFEVLVAGTKLGHGYCGHVQCHYQVSGPDLFVEETLTFHEGKLYRIGSKGKGESHYYWEEVLEKVNE